MRIDDKTAEKYLLNRFFHDTDYHEIVVDNFDRRFFDNEVVADILQIAIDYYREHERLDLKRDLCGIQPLVLAHLKTKCKESHIENYVQTLANCLKMTMPHDDFVRSSVLDFVKSKAMYYAIYDNLETMEKEKDANVCMERFQKISSIGFDKDMGFDYFRDIRRNLAELSSPMSVIPTGFRTLDKLIEGGIPRHDQTLTVFMAQSGLGKSLMLSNLAVNFVDQELFVVIISLEMSEKMYSARIHSKLTKTNIKHVRSSANEIETAVNKYHTARPGGKLVIKNWAAYTVNANHVSNYIKKLERVNNRKVDVIIVDYINLLLPTVRTKSQTLYERVGDVALELRTLSDSFRRPVITATQVNRSGYNNSSVGMENTSESAGINNTADFIGALWQTEEDRGKAILNMNICKDRYGGNAAKTVAFHIDYATLTVSDPEEEVKIGTFAYSTSELEHDISDMTDV